MNVLEKINHLRKEKGWSVYKLAEESGLTQSTLSNMFARKSNPSISTLSQICEGLKISMKDFFDEEASSSFEFVAKKYKTLSEKDRGLVNELIERLSKN